MVDLHQDDPRIAAPRERGPPVVAVGHPTLTGGFPSVRTDDRTAVAEAVRCLAALGHRRIARLPHPTLSAISHDVHTFGAEVARICPT